MSVEIFCCFFPILRQSHILFNGGSVVAEYKRGSIENCLPMRRTVRLFQSLIGGGGEGGGGNVKFIMAQPKCVIRSDFSPMTLEIFTSRRKKKNPMSGGIKHSHVTFSSLENLVPAQVSSSRRTESHKIQSNTTQQNGTEMETN